MLNTGFKPVLNGEAKVLALSPDKTRLYVGGTFTTVNGASRSGIVAFDTSTGRVVDTFKATVNGAVYGLSATSTTVYVGGSFCLGERQQPAGPRRLPASDGGLLERLDAGHRPDHLLGPGDGRRARRPGGRRRLVPDR